MRVPIRRLTLLLACLAPAPAALALDPWVAVGPGGSVVKSLAMDPTTPTTLYPGTTSGAYKSTDGGRTWTSSGLDGLEVNALVFDPLHPTVLYAGTLGAGVLRTTGGGREWNAGGAGLPSGAVGAPAIDPRGTV